MTFRVNPNMARAVSSSPQVTRLLEGVAREMVTAIEAATPRYVKEEGHARFESGVTGVGVNRHAYARVRSPLWHLDEFGTINQSPRPYIRPAVQAVLNRRGGRLVRKGK